VHVQRALASLQYQQIYMAHKCPVVVVGIVIASHHPDEVLGLENIIVVSWLFDYHFECPIKHQAYEVSKLVKADVQWGRGRLGVWCATFADVSGLASVPLGLSSSKSVDSCQMQEL
jgi:hypothetical protein